MYFPSEIQCGLARVGEADIVRGQGWAAPPPGYDLQAEILSLSQPPSQARPPRHGQTTKHRGFRQKPIKVGDGRVSGGVGGAGYL